MHDASKVLLGATQSSAKEISAFGSDPANFPAGLACRLKSDGTLSLIKADGSWVGVSVGRSLSDHKKTAVLRSGTRVPVQAELKRASGVVTISSYANLVSGSADTLTVAGVEFTAQSSAATPGDATFRAATANSNTATSLATQINAHSTAGAAVLAVASNATVTLYAKEAGAAGNDLGVSYTDNDTNVGITLSGLSDGKLSGGSDDVTDIDYLTKGAKAYFNDSTGKADLSAFGTLSDATYIDGPLTGVMEDSSEVGSAVVDMTGGL